MARRIPKKRQHKKNQKKINQNYNQRQKQQESKLIDVVEAGEQTAGTGTGTVGGTGGYYSPINEHGRSQVDTFVKAGGVHDLKGTEKVSNITGWFRGSSQQDAYEQGRSVLGLMGSDAIRGAAWGGVAGGALEAAQGGSFWDGAKQGAFNGAAGYTAARALKRGTGADSYLFGENSIIKSGGAMMRSMSQNPEVSKQAIAILNQRQLDGLARSVMNNK